MNGSPLKLVLLGWGFLFVESSHLRIGAICGIFGSQVQRDTVNRPKFIDLFCGIGGMRLAFESVGAQCVFSSDWDKHAQITYEANFGEKPHGDLRAIASDDLPQHDILVAGFPCQPFSISGVSMKDRLLLESQR